MIELMYWHHNMFVPTGRTYSARKFDDNYFEIIIFPNSSKECVMLIHKNYIRKKKDELS